MPGHATSFPPNIIDTDQLYDGAVTAAKLDPSIVISAASIPAGSITDAMLAGSITADKLATGVLTLIVTTAQRKGLTPTTGQQVYDTTLLKPCWWNGTLWTDATGAAVDLA
jgi:hypothetical protein